MQLKYISDSVQKTVNWKTVKCTSYGSVTKFSVIQFFII